MFDLKNAMDDASDKFTNFKIVAPNPLKVNFFRTLNIDISF